MATNQKTRKSRKKSRSRKFSLAVLGKPTGVIQPRVQEAGPEKFGVVAVDCAKARSMWMLADFYGKVLVEPVQVEHQRAQLKLAVCQLQAAVEKHQLRDLIVAVEMTGTYHKPILRTFRDAGFETRLVHPFASSHFRLPEHGDLKTDEHDLAAIFRAAVNGFGLLEKPVVPLYEELKILARHRRDLVCKRSNLQRQIRHYVQLCLPGFPDQFEGEALWETMVPLPFLQILARRGAGAKEVVEAGEKGVSQWLREAAVRVYKPTVQRIVTWASNAADPDPFASSHTRIWSALLEDWLAKKTQITALERDLAGLLAQTPYLLTLSHPGINVVSAAELAGEMGPIENYASAKSVSGRAGLFPSRYQSDGTDRGGNLSRFRNARLRAAWTQIADNMTKCNQYWQRKNQVWSDGGCDPHDVRCRIANRMTRILFQMVSGRKLYDHPSRLDRSYVMQKLLEFHTKHKTSPDVIVRDLEHAARQIPPRDRRDEAQPLVDMHKKGRSSRRQGPQSMAVLMVGVLARLGIDDLEDETVESS